MFEIIMYLFLRKVKGWILSGTLEAKWVVEAVKKNNDIKKWKKIHLKYLIIKNRNKKIKGFEEAVRIT